MRLEQTIPALPVRDVATGVDFYRDRLGFSVLHHDDGFAVVAQANGAGCAGICGWECGYGPGPSARSQ